MKGTLAARCPADVVSEVQRRQWSGVLRFQRGGLARQLYIDAGAMVRFAASTFPGEGMTALFTERGGLSDDQLRQATAAKAADELLGTTLVRHGLLTRPVLLDLTQIQIRRVARGALSDPAGEFEFDQSALPFREQLDGGLSTAEILLEWARRLEDIDWLKRRLGPPAGRIQRASRPPEGYQNVRLEAGEGFIMSRVDGVATVEEICTLSPIGDLATLRALVALGYAGILAMPPEATEIPLPGIRGPLTGDAPAPGERASRRAPAAAPLRSVAPRAATPPPAAHGPANGGAPKAPPPPRIAAAVTERVRPTADGALEGEMLRRFEHLHDQTLFEVLGVAPTASTDEIRRAYYGLARRFHPDKFQSEAIKAKAEKVFAHITEAYSTLTHTESRRKYDEDLNLRQGHRPQEKTVDAADLARFNFKHGKDQYDKGKYGEAMSFLQNACNQDPSKAEYFHYLGITQAKNPRWKKQAEESLLKAIELSPSNAQPYADLGSLYAKGGLHSKAREMFTKALQWDPMNEEARLGLATEEGGKKGLLRMFGRK